MEQATTTSAVPPEFVEATKDALDHLYDIPRLNHHPLARWLRPGQLPPGVSHAQALRQRLIEAIERLNPGDRVAAAARQKRASHLLELRYVEAMSFSEVMRTLALSQTQYHREQRHAIEMVAAYLWDTLLVLPEDLSRRPEEADRRLNASSTNEGSLSLTKSTPGRPDDEVHLVSFLADIVRLLKPVAAERHVCLRAALTDEDAGADADRDATRDDAIRTDRTALRNAVIGATGFLLEGARSGEIAVAASRPSGRIQIDVIHRGTPSAIVGGEAHEEKLRWSRELMQAIGGTLRLRDEGDGHAISLELPVKRPTLLVIDDNPDLIQLIARYLIDQDYAVLGAGSVEEGCATARSTRPDVILLDVMMPHRDGWDALQLLRHHPVTSQIPIVVCTVLAEDQLARALGATAFIRKPLTRPALLRVLEQCLADRRRSAGERRGALAPRARSD